MLNNLEVVNGSMSPEFKSDIFDYQVEVEKDVLALVLDYEAPFIIEVYENELFTYTLKVLKEETQTMSGIIDNYEKVEVSAETPWIQNLITPGISVVCFITIVFLFCVIFKKK